MNDIIMEEGERKTVNIISASQVQTPPISNLTANGQLLESARKVSSPTQLGGNSGCLGDGFVGVASKIFSSKIKRKGSPRDRSDRRTDKHNGCDDDLPLGSEAHCLSMDYISNIEDSKYPLPEDKRSKWRRTTSQGLMGWQSFNSDVSNQTSASSASLEQLLNDRQVDPEEMLRSLGFGGEPHSLMPTLARVPDRFLHHPSRAYGIAPAGCSEEEVEDSTDAAAAPLPDKSAPSAPASAMMPQARKRSGIWTLARTLSMLRLKSTSSRGHMSPSSNSSGTQPLTNQLVSILHPSNQRYLASRGFYEKQGWPKGTFAEPEDDSLHAVKEEVESKDAASKRRIFKKTRPHRNWSICDSEENEAAIGGREWISKSVDGYQNREDFAGQDDSLGRGTYFSTTTESSTDSLDTPNLETERAFESIRQEYERSRQERSSSDDLFLPSRKDVSSSEDLDNDDNLASDNGLDLLGFNIASTNYFVSPASSRQTTVEKAPTICDQSPSVNLNEDGVDDGGDVNKREDASRSEGQGQLRANSSDLTSIKGGNLHHTDGGSKDDVRIIISSSDNKDGRPWSQGGNHQDHNGKSSRLTVKGAQKTSSDSGSSSATAVGSSNSTLTADKSEPRHPSESETSITDWDSISRTNSPRDFGQRSDMVSISCQTTDADFNFADTANQNGNSNTQSTNNRSVLFVRINESGVTSPTQDMRRGDFAVIQQSPKVQLSTFPPTISHLELMRRLQHSQNELSRMGSVQSDSSGFGDGDPVVEPDSLKLKIPREAVVEADIESSHVKQNSKPTGQGDHYVTMCYIPTLTSTSHRSAALKRRARAAGDGDHFVSYQGRVPMAVPVCRPRSGSDPRRPGLDSRRPWPMTDAGKERCSLTDLPPGIRAGSRDLKLGQSFLHAHPQLHSEYADLYKCEEPHRQAGHYNAVDYNSGSGRDVGSSKRTFTSQIDLFTNEQGFSSQGGPTFDSHNLDSNVGLRRHLDEGILEGRNSAPLSVELALVRASGIKPVSPRYSTFSTGRIVTARNTGLVNPALVTPIVSKTEADFQFSLIAGNISGLHSRHVSDKPIDSCMTPRSASRQKSCDILDDDFEDKDSLMTQSHSRISDDLDAGSPMTENSSEFSVQSAPEGYGHIKSGILESRKLARLINQPIHFMGVRRSGQLYHPSHIFQDWTLLSKRKRLQEENRLLQISVQKYKTELTILEASLMVDCQAGYPDMTNPEKEELEELEWLWGEVKGQVVEMEHILMARVKAVHAGNEFYCLMSSLGIISRMVELIKEQICQQQMASGRTEEAKDRSMDDIFGGEISYDGRHHSFQASQGWMSTPWPVRRFQSSSTTNLPHELNLSLEQMKSSVLSQVQGEIKESTRKLEQSLQEKDCEIKILQEQLISRSLSLPDQQPKRWTPRSSASKSQRVLTKFRSSKVLRYISCDIFISFVNISTPKSPRASISSMTILSGPGAYTKLIMCVNHVMRTTLFIQYKAQFGFKSVCEHKGN